MNAGNPTSRRSQLANQYGQQRVIKAGQPESERQKIQKPQVRQLNESPTKAPSSAQRNAAKADPRTAANSAAKPVKKQTSREAEEVANLPDFVSMAANKDKKPSPQELLSQIKKNELDRVNKKFGVKKPEEESHDKELLAMIEPPSAKQSTEDDSVLDRTTNLLDEAEKALLCEQSPTPHGRESSLL